MTTPPVAAAVGAMIGGTLAAIYYEHNKPSVSVVTQPAPVFSRPPPPMPPPPPPPPKKPEPFAAVGVPDSLSDIKLFGEGSSNSWASLFDAQRRIPRWVLEHVTPASFESKDQSDKGDRSKSSFHSNTDIPSPFRATNSDYATTAPDKGQIAGGFGLSRGHLAPAQFHRCGGQEALDATFDLSLNIVPQDMTMNAGDWFRLEQLFKRWASGGEGDFVDSWILTGPLFMPQDNVTVLEGEKTKRQFYPRAVTYPVIGNRDIAVPTHMFKAILAKPKAAKEGYGFAAFVIPNGPITDEVPLQSYEVTREDLESATGLKVFPKIQEKDTFSICKKLNCDAKGSGSFGAAYRSAAVIRGANSLHELDAQYEKSSKTKVLDKEYETRKRLLEKVNEVVLQNKE